jgi:hypothetical protein
MQKKQYQISHAYVPLKGPKCEILDPHFFTLLNSIYVGNLGTGFFLYFFFEMGLIFAILFF